MQKFKINAVTDFNTDSGWFRADTDQGILIGTSPVAPIGEIEVEATKTTHETFGEQWKATGRISWESDKALTLAVLSMGVIKGVKYGKSAPVFNMFGEYIFDILDAAQNNTMIEWEGRKRNPKDLLQDAHGVGPSVSQQMIDGWKESKYKLLAARDFVRCDLPPKLFGRISSTAKESSKFYDFLHNVEPYTVYDLLDYGIPFEEVDRVALLEWKGKEPIPHDSPLRSAGIIRYILRKLESREGHVCAPVNVVVNEAKKWNIDNIIEFTSDLEKYGLRIYKDMVYTYTKYSEESYIAGTLQRIAHYPNRGTNLVFVPSESIRKAAPNGIELADQQVKAIQMALTERVSIITGGPGTGKTTITDIICFMLRDRGISVELVAPTGAAARRLAVATGQDAQTIHRCFNLNGHEQTFVEHGYLIVDETSMLSNDLLYQMLSHVDTTNVSIIFIGDVDQLPPVGYGEPFRQMFDMGIPYVRLDTVYRNRGAIAQACHDINNGKIPAPDNETFFLTTQTLPNEMQDRVISGLEYFNKNGWGSAQVLTPVNSKELVGRHAINDLLQGHYNPKGGEVPFTNVKTGDRVVQTKNNYSVLAFNGMIGTCTEVTDAGKVALRQMRDGEVSISDEDEIAVVEFDDEDGKGYLYDRADIVDLQLGYAVTVHKSQGNQFDNVILLLPPDLGPLASRQIVYTAASRAKKHLAILSAPGVLAKCLRNDKKVRRYSMLAEMVKESLAYENIT